MAATFQLFLSRSLLLFLSSTIVIFLQPCYCRVHYCCHHACHSVSNSFFSIAIQTMDHQTVLNRQASRSILSGSIQRFSSCCSYQWSPCLQDNIKSSCGPIQMYTDLPGWESTERTSKLRSAMNKR